MADDPYPEHQAQLWLDELVFTARMDRGDITRAIDGWKNAATALKDVADRLNSRSASSSLRREVWSGEASDKATAAFDVLAAKIVGHSGRMLELANALTEVDRAVADVATAITEQIGTKLKEKKKGGLLGALDAAKDKAVDFADAGIEHMAASGKAIGQAVTDPSFKNIGKAVAITGMGSIAHELLLDKETTLSREDQFREIERVHKQFCTFVGVSSMSLSMLASDAGIGRIDSKQDDAMRQLDLKAPPVSAAESRFHEASQRGVPMPNTQLPDPALPRNPFVTTTPTGSLPLPGDPVRVTVDGALQRGPTLPTSSDTDYSPGSGLPGSSPSNSGMGALTGGAGAAAGLGAAVAGGMGLARAGLGGGLGGAGGGTSGVIGGAAGAAGAARGGSPGLAGMAGGMGGAPGGPSSDKGRGPNYGNGPRLPERDRRRRGPKAAVLGAGSRADAEGGASGSALIGAGEVYDEDEY